MTSHSENQILFDDDAALKDNLGKDYLGIRSVTGDCDCSGYTSIQDDEAIDPSESAGVAS